MSDGKSDAAKEDAAYQRSFDDACASFTKACERAASWRHNYFGAAYSTRIKQAIRVLKVEIANVERHPEIDDMPKAGCG